MILRHHDIYIQQGKPFANCQLGREKYADVLNSIVNSHPSGFVLAINNRWGTGKTTFVKMWEQSLKDSGHKTVYFNAWENDFEDNALIAIMGELKTLTKKATDREFKTALKSAATLAKHIAPAMAKAVVDKYIDSDTLKDALTKLSEGVTDIFEKKVNEYATKKKGIEDFRKNLSDFIEKINDNRPIIFIIDELDRCRPNYAVSILEQIKHFFSVQNIIFVLSIDKIQLGNAVRGFYGSDRIDADEYLKRFIDIEYTIPEPEPGIFYKYLYNYFQFDTFISSKERRNYPSLHSDKSSFLAICEILFNSNPITLRQQEKIFVLARLALKGFKSNYYLVPFIYLFLIFIKITHHELYYKLKHKQLSIQELQRGILSLVGTNRNDDLQRGLILLEAYLVNAYARYLHPHSSPQRIIEYDSTTGKNKALIKSVITNNEDEFLSYLVSINNGRGEGDLNLDYFLKRIDLLEPLN